MLIFNPRRIFGLRGIERANSYLVKNGYTASIANRLLVHGLPHVKVSSLGRLCQLLNCTPNDLFDWHQDPKAPLAENHALNALIRSDNREAISDILKALPLEKLADLHTMIDELKKK